MSRLLTVAVAAIAVLVSVEGALGLETGYGYGYAFNAALTVKNDDGSLSSRCGAALVSPGMALTAAHCLDVVDLEKLRLAFDRSDLKGADVNAPYVVRVRKALVHPSFTRDATTGAVSNDIAALYLETCMNTVQPALVNAAPDRDAEGQSAIALGWGPLDCSVDKPVPNTNVKLLTVTANAPRNSKCQRSSEGTPDVVQGVLCITPTRKDLASPPMCGADSGAPVVGKTQEGQYVMLGVVSKAMLSGEIATARASAYVQWIETVMMSDRCVAGTKMSSYFITTPQTQGKGTTPAPTDTKKNPAAPAVDPVQYGIPAVPKANGSGSTCENTGKSCPFSSAVCCKTNHCCPKGYYCSHYSTATLCVPGSPTVALHEQTLVAAAAHAAAAVGDAALVVPVVPEVKLDPTTTVATVYDQLQQDKAKLDAVIGKNPGTTAAKQAVATESEMLQKFGDIPPLKLKPVVTPAPSPAVTPAPAPAAKAMCFPTQDMHDKVKAGVEKNKALLAMLGENGKNLVAIAEQAGVCPAGTVSCLTKAARTSILTFESQLPAEGKQFVEAAVDC